MTQPRSIHDPLAFDEVMALAAKIEGAPVARMNLSLGTLCGTLRVIDNEGKPLPGRDRQVPLAIDVFRPATTPSALGYNTRVPLTIPAAVAEALKGPASERLALREETLRRAREALAQAERDRDAARAEHERLCEMVTEAVDGSAT